MPLEVVLHWSHNLFYAFMSCICTWVCFCTQICWNVTWLAHAIQTDCRISTSDCIKVAFGLHLKLTIFCMSRSHLDLLLHFQTLGHRWSHLQSYNPNKVAANKSGEFPKIHEYVICCVTWSKQTCSLAWFLSYLRMWNLFVCAPELLVCNSARPECCTCVS